MLHTVSDLDLRLLRVFLAIVDAGGVSAAQASLGVGQSTLSSQLSTLETRLGFSLCERGRGGFRLIVQRMRGRKVFRRRFPSRVEKFLHLAARGPINGRGRDEASQTKNRSMNQSEAK